MANSGYEKIPPVYLISDQLVRRFPKIDPGYLTQVVRDQLFLVRKNISAFVEDDNIEQLVLTRCTDHIDRILSGTLEPVINGTGIVLHTGLGRAPLALNLLNELLPAWSGYMRLEFDLNSGDRGDRNLHNTELLRYLTGAETGVAVNNNAAAVLLALTALAKGGEVIVNRAQLVEIGGSFRIPDVMEQSGAVMTEVGTTNRTHLKDYIKAISPRTQALFVAHTSNYRVVGFTAQPSISELADEAHKRNLPLIYDLGSGMLRDMSAQYITDESIVRDVIAAGADVVTFSGDKLLGGVQTGIIVGSERYLSILRQHPLMRAVRCDKLILSLLQKTLVQYIRQDGKLLSHELLSRTREELQRLANRITEQVETRFRDKIIITETTTEAGSGAAPILQIPSLALMFELPVTAESLAELFRIGEPAVVGYIRQDRFYIDLKAVLDKDVQPLVERINEVFGRVS